MKTALDAGKHVFCEWPLGNGLREAEELAALANAKNVRPDPLDLMPHRMSDDNNLRTYGSSASALSLISAWAVARGVSRAKRRR